MSELSKEEIFQEIGKIIAKFNLYECDDCVRAIMQWLGANGIEGKIIKLKTKYNEDFILSERLERQGITEAVTINGRHYGVEVLGLVYDNISPFL
ncbi:papain fold toxin domain-containing protein [Floridanema aerugineum]|uniref:Papain fold toxin domain-containing protein n=1 Tax=Floridaenema aerugineum BLCC-F46 TaxID=3153654 RepID=A0ABV4X8C1_9CYAN